MMDNGSHKKASLPVKPLEMRKMREGGGRHLRTKWSIPIIRIEDKREIKWQVATKIAGDWRTPTKRADGETTQLVVAKRKEGFKEQGKGRAQMVNVAKQGELFKMKVMMGKGVLKCKKTATMRRKMARWK